MQSLFNVPIFVLDIPQQVTEMLFLCFVNIQIHWNVLNQRSQGSWKQVIKLLHKD